MIRTEIRRCRKCHRVYIKTNGGVIFTPGECFDRGLCPKCRLLVKW